MSGDLIGGAAKRLVAAGYDRVSLAYRGDDFALAGSAYERSLGWILPELASGSRALDLGCGCGVPVTQALAARCETVAVDISGVQLRRARVLIPGAQFVRADMGSLEFAQGAFHAVVAFYSIIHVPVEEQPALFGRLAEWLRPGGLLLASLGKWAWTGTESDWLNVPGGTMYWSHADTATYRAWLARAGLRIEREGFIPEGSRGHSVFLARKPGAAAERSAC